MTRSGWLTNLKEKWWTNNPNKVNCDTSNSGDNSSGISVMNIFGVFLVTGGLAIVCIITLVIEFCYLEEKLCLRKYQEHHPKHPTDPQVSIVPAFDESKYNSFAQPQNSSSEKNDYDVQHHASSGKLTYSMY